MAQVSRGAIGEVFAARFLRDKKWTILTANYRSRFGEIDIIAQDRSYIVFVEVKTRAIGAWVTPAEAVTKAKQRKIIQNATRRHMMKRGDNDMNDAIEAEGNLQDVIEMLANLRVGWIQTVKVSFSVIVL